ncbi:MAG TPA: MBL fold metallo-hydrolase [Candidatus Binataceae bacterium]|jgi:glyoxylase-like metal-dependent hydrolase (beta-lactamase superfamily II)/rhodanese-related sulfurtransferase|nr:MBL fold metallo-hydrolase [Candidatus Binataceae bacterium]
MLFHELNRSGCKTYLLACEQSGLGVLIDPVKDRCDRYLAVLAYYRIKLELIIDTHTHADHRTACWDLRDLIGARVVMHRRAPAPHVDIHVDDGQRLEVGSLSLEILHTPGHTPDSVSIRAADRVFTGDTLMIRGTGRADFAGGDPGEEYDSITKRLFALPDNLLVFPAHDYRGHTSSTIGEEKRLNPRLAGKSRAAYVEIMNNLNLPLPDKIQEALQSNETAIDDDSIKFPSFAQLNQVRQLAPAQVSERLASGNPPLLLDVREEDEYNGELGHIAGSILVPLKDLPARAAEFDGSKGGEVVAICRAGVRSTTAGAILTGLGFEHVYNMRGGMLDWLDAGLPVERAAGKAG